MSLLCPKKELQPSSVTANQNPVMSDFTLKQKVELRGCTSLYILESEPTHLRTSTSTKNSKNSHIMHLWKWKYKDNSTVSPTAPRQKEITWISTKFCHNNCYSHGEINTGRSKRRDHPNSNVKCMISDVLITSLDSQDGVVSGELHHCERSRNPKLVSCLQGPF